MAVIDLTDKFHKAEFMSGGPDNWAIDRSRFPFQNVIVHHTGSHISLGVPWAYGVRTDGSATTQAQEEMAILSLARDHKSRFGIGPGYYYAGFLSGRFYAIGKAGTVRRHTTNTDGRTDGYTWNHDSIAIVLFGNFNHAKPTPALTRGLLEVIRDIRQSPVAVDDARLMDHNAANPRTECAGSNTRDMLAALPKPSKEQPVSLNADQQYVVNQIRATLDITEEQKAAALASVGLTAMPGGTSPAPSTSTPTPVQITTAVRLLKESKSRIEAAERLLGA